LSYEQAKAPLRDERGFFLLSFVGENPKRERDVESHVSAQNAQTWGHAAFSELLTSSVKALKV
jgi:hypothetical protein